MNTLQLEGNCHAIQVCRACLSSDGTLSVSNQIQEFAEIIKHTVTTLILCSKCSVLLKKYGKFKDMCMLSDQNLTTMGLVKCNPEYLQLLKDKYTKEVYRLSKKVCIDEYDLDCSFSPSKLKYEFDDIAGFDDAADFDEKVDFDEKADFDENDDSSKDRRIDDDSVKVEQEIEIDGELPIDISNLDANIVEIKPNLIKINTKVDVKKPKKAKIKKKPDKRIVKTVQIKGDADFDDCFDIKNLSKEEQRDVFEKRQFDEKYVNAVFKCDLCYKAFATKSAHEQHIERHKDKTPYECDFCKMCYDRPGQLTSHLKRHSQIFTCKRQLCDYESMNRNLALLHLRWHKGVKYQCAVCGDEFSKKTTLANHKRVKHPTDDYVCELCGYSFVGQQGKDNHLALKHKGDSVKVSPDGPRCTDCNIQFANENAFFVHMNVSPKHGNSVRNDPQQQARLSESKSPRGRKPRLPTEAINLREAKMAKMADNGPPIICEQCGHESFSPTTYGTHFSRLHPNCTRTQYLPTDKPSLCHTCGKTFRNESALKIHMHNYHSGITYTCDICHKVFNRRQQLYHHAKVHIGKKYPCPTCGKTFNQVSNRNRHYTHVHSDVRDVKCDFCEKTFKREAEKRAHTTHVHFKKPYKKRFRGKRDESKQGGEVDGEYYSS